ncbi:MAG: tetratricopeptide repeat protein [Planctomycetota bacterium]
MSKKISGKLGPHKDGTGHSPARRRILYRILIPLFIVVVASVCYLNADHERFYFDSAFADSNIVKPEHTCGPLQVIKNYWQGRLNPDAPLAYITFAWNYSFNKAVGLDGFDITTFLAFNVIIHILNTCLVYLLIRRLLGLIEPQGPPAIWIPLGLAVLFTVHPMHASSIAYIIQRRGLLASLFYLLGVLTYLKVRQNRGVRTELSVADIGRQDNFTRWGSGWPWKRIALAASIPVLFWLSFRCKNMGITLPFAILAIEFCFRASDWRALKGYLLVLIPCLVLAVVGMFGFAWWKGLFDPATFQIGSWAGELAWGPWEHFLTESRAFWHYWRMLILPLPRWSCIDHDFVLSRSLFDHYTIFAIGFHVLLLLGALLAARRGYVLAAAGIFWFYVALIPYVILPQSELLVEYKTYLPSIGLVLIFAEFCRLLCHRIPIKVTVPLAGVLAVVLMTTTISRNVIYQSGFNLWSDVAEKSPNNYRAYNSLGVYFFFEGRIEESIAQYHKVLRLVPNHDRAHNNLGNSLLEQKQYDKAIQHYMKAVQSNPKYTHAYLNWGAALARQGKYEEAIDRFDKALELSPDSFKTHYQYGLALVQLNRLDEAIEHFAATVKLAPNYAEAYYCMGLAQARKGDVDNAIKSYQETLRIEPGYADVHQVLANALQKQGRIEEAIEHFTEAVRIMPELVEAHNSLGNILLNQGRYDAAIELFSKALEYRPDFAKAYLNWGLALAGQGKFDGAVERFNRLLELDSSSIKGHYNLGLALARLKRMDEALAHFSEAVVLDPGYADAHYCMGLVLAGKGENDKAIKAYKQALRINPQHQQANQALKQLTGK